MQTGQNGNAHSHVFTPFKHQFLTRTSFLNKLDHKQNEKWLHALFHPYWQELWHYLSLTSMIIFLPFSNMFSHVFFVCLSVFLPWQSIYLNWPCLHTLALSNPAGRQADSGVQNPKFDGFSDTLARVRGGTTKRLISIPFKPCDSL